MMAISSLQVVTGYYNSLGTPAINTAVTAQLGAGWIPHGAPVLTDVYGQVAQVMVKSNGLTTTAYSIATGASPMAADATWDALGDPLWIDSTQYLQAYTKGAQVTSLINLTNQVSGILPIANGGTNANNIDGARANLQAFLESPTQLSGNLNNYDGTRSGLHMQSSNAGATTANNYPVNTAGTLLVIANGANSASSCRQIYYPHNSDDAYSRWFNPIGSIWSPWSRTSYANGITPIANGGTGANTAALARTNLSVDRFQQLTNDQTRIYSGDSNYYFEVNNGRDWGVYSPLNNSWLSLGITQGGTGANNVNDARVNLQVSRFIRSNASRTIISSVDTAFTGAYLELNNNGTWGFINAAGNAWLPLGIGQGGTGATTATDARTNLGVGAIGTLNSVNLTSNVTGTLPVANGGTGATTATDARTNLGVGTIGTLNSVSLTSNVTGTLPIANGGTGSNTTAGARTNLGVGTIGTLNSVNLTSNVTGTLPIANGGTGATTVTNARTNLGVDRFQQLTNDQSRIYSGNGNYYFEVNNGRDWGVYNTASGWLPLAVGQGGTGATNAADARANLGAAAASDRTIKREIKDYDGNQSLANIAAITPRTFVFNNDPENRVRRGVIAQEMEAIDPEYVTRATRTTYDTEGNPVVDKDILILDNNVLLMDALIAIKVLEQRVAELESKLN